MNSGPPEPTIAPESPTGAVVKPTFREAFLFWLKLGFISFGGPAGQIAIMHTELVDRRRWIGNERFLHALNFCMLLPGPEAQQLATYCGWLLHRTWGGIVAGTLFFLPSVFVLWTLSYLYVAFGDVFVVSAALAGLKPAVLAIVAGAVIRIGKKALRNPLMWGLAAAAFVAIFFFRAPFPLIIASAGVMGWIGSRVRPDLFVPPPSKHGIETKDGEKAAPVEPAQSERPSWKRSCAVVAVCLALWWSPVLIAAQVLGPDHAVPQQGVFFSKAALVTIGGAYAVLPYVAQRAVEDFGWLGPDQMLDGLGLAETTPGPLIMVLQFVGFVGGWQHPGDLSPLVAATLGALMTTWVTFLPCFLWIFLGAPFIERLQGHAGMTGALSTITAAVVGVILNLAVWFGLHVLFPAGSADWFGVAVCAVALAATIRWKVDVLWIVAGGLLAGIMGGWLGWMV